MKTSSFFRYILLLMVCAFGPGARAQSVAEADSAYSQGKYAEAVDIYEKIIEEKGVSAALLYNLGNARAKGGDYGKAMVAYLRALRLDPSDGMVKANIRYIESKVLEANKNELRGRKFALEPDHDSFAKTMKNFIVRDHSSNMWAAWAAGCFVAFVILLVIYIFSRVVLLRKIGFFAAGIMLGLSLIALVFAFMSATYRSDEGVITSAKVQLRTEANNTSKEVAVSLTRGTCMRILDYFPAGTGKPEWYKVKLNSDFIGWIPASDFEPVEPPREDK